MHRGTFLTTLIGNEGQSYFSIKTLYLEEENRWHVYSLLFYMLCYSCCEYYQSFCWLFFNITNIKVLITCVNYI